MIDPFLDSLEKSISLFENNLFLKQWLTLNNMTWTVKAYIHYLNLTSLQ